MEQTGCRREAIQTIEDVALGSGSEWLAQHKPHVSAVEFTGCQAHKNAIHLYDTTPHIDWCRPQFHIERD